MARTAKIILSASRRTDIPAFYMAWFMEQINCGSFQVTNPYNRVTRTVDASPEAVHTIVFWSKNFAVFLNSGAGEILTRKGYHLFFNFTVNSDSRLLEAGIPPLEERLHQMGMLCRNFGPEAVAWRFDPICFFNDSAGQPGNNLADFSTIANGAGKLGVSRCITSFYDDYAKIRRRLACLKGSGHGIPTFVDPGPEKKLKLLLRMEGELKGNGIRLYTCCEKELAPLMPGGSTIKGSACIPGKYLKSLYGGNPDTKRDYGQRAKQGCLCTRSVDIGSYDSHPCFHNCSYCYAGPAVDLELKQGRG